MGKHSLYLFGADAVKENILIISPKNNTKCGLTIFSSEIAVLLRKKGNDVNIFNLDMREGFINYIRQIFEFNKIISQRYSLINVQFAFGSSGPLILIIQIISKIKKIPVLLTIHEKPSCYFKNRIFNFFIIKFYNLMISFSDKVILHTRDQYKEIASYNKRIAKKIVVCEHILNISKHKTFKRQFKYKYILFFGSIKESKGILDLLKAYTNMHTKYKLVIAGYLNNKDKLLKSKINQYLMNHKNIILQTNISDKYKFQLVSQAEMLVLPYLKNTQSGVLYREAIPFNKPVVVSNIGGIAETVKRYKIGIIFKKGDIVDLERAINKILTDDVLRKKIIKRIRFLNTKKYVTYNNELYIREYYAK